MNRRNQKLYEAIIGRHNLERTARFREETGRHIIKSDSEVMNDRAQELYERRGGRPGLSGATSPNGCGRRATLKKTNYVLSELRSCVKVEVDVLGSLPVPDSVYGLCGRRATLK